MAVPPFQSFLLPLLQLAGDGHEHQMPAAMEALAVQLGLSDDDRRELVPSGRRTRLRDRAHWAKTYLQAAGLLSTPTRGHFVITEEGRRLLAESPPRIDIPLLLKYESFRKFKLNSGQNGDSTNQDGQKEATAGEAPTPADAMESAYRQHRAALTSELLSLIKSMSPEFFEGLVVQLMLRLGYGGPEGRGTELGRSGDGGVDGVISEDKLGLDTIYLQAKRWEGPVGRPVVQAFVGSLEGFRSRKGVLITTSSFSADAKSYVKNIEKRVVLIDGEELANLMIDTGLGLTPETTYTLARIDSDFFLEEA